LRRLSKSDIGEKLISANPSTRDARDNAWKRNKDARRKGTQRNKGEEKEKAREN
jgi:hypothetical protein